MPKWFLYVLIGGLLLSLALCLVALNRKRDAVPTTITFDTPITPPVPKIDHHYRMQINGASIWRFDDATGEVCWFQLSINDAHTPIPQCPVPPTFSNIRPLDQ
jgi:hypothetical protein